MIFKQIDEIISGKKTQTRRVIKMPATGNGVEGEMMVGYPNGVQTANVYRNGKWCVKWQVGRTYAVQPNRGEKAVGRIKLLAIRQEWLQEMSLADCAAEGIPPHTFARGCLSKTPPDPRWKYIELWNSINTRKGTRWEDNPLVFALTFERVENGEG